MSKTTTRGTALGNAHMGPNEPILPNFSETRVVVRFSYSSAKYHLLEVYGPRGNAVVQIKSDCPREIVASLAAHVTGLGVV